MPNILSIFAALWNPIKDILIVLFARKSGEDKVKHDLVQRENEILKKQNEIANNPDDIDPIDRMRDNDL